MTSDHRPPPPAEWAEVRRLLDGAIDLPQEQWDAYLEANRASAPVRQEVLELLAQRSDTRLPRYAHARPEPQRTPGLPAGTYVGHYAIVRRLGAGGMGTVYLARDERLGRAVALKVLRRQPDQRSRDRLLREARAVAALDHPSICAVHEVGSDPTVGDFIVMPFIDGGTLADRLTRGPMRPTQAVMVCRQLAEALAEAHAHGIVHRDLKPQNVAVDAGGRPRLLDFGIARTLRRAADAGMTTTQVTEVGVVAGTPSYMAPEQIRGEHVDGRSDLFSLGCVLYECLTGRRAFDGSTAQEICGQVLHVTPLAPSAVRPDLHHDHDVLCLRLLEKEPGHRFQSAEEASGALRLVETGTTVPVVPPFWQRPLGRRPLLGLAAGLVLTAVLALTQAVWPKRLPEAPPDARQWYELGIDALRSDSFAVALSRLQEAVRLFPDYVEAHARMAEAHAELDDQSAAQQALLKVVALVPDESDLATDDRLRVRGVRASVLREHDQALAAYAELARRHASDAGVLVDLANAQDAAGRWAEARETLARAVQIDPQNASALLRLGVLHNRLGELSHALESIDNAIRLYGVAANVEGEAEGWLRRGIVASGAAQFDEADDALQRVLRLTADERYAVLRLRAMFELAAVQSWRGQAAEAQKQAEAAVDDAIRRRLFPLAASGLVNLARASIADGRNDAARAVLGRAIALARETGATRTEMQARLLDAAIVAQGDAPGDAIAVTEDVQRYAEANGLVLMEADARSILARIHAYQRRFETAATLADDLVAIAERGGDELLLTDALETLASVRNAQGRLTEALAHQHRLTAIYKRRRDEYAMPGSLVNEAELLVSLGRGGEAQVLLDEMKAGIASGHTTYVRRSRRVAFVEALRATVEGRWSDAEHLAAGAIEGGQTPLDATARVAWALRCLAAAREHRREPSHPDLLDGLPAGSHVGREIRYWLLLTARSTAPRAETTRALAEQLLDEPTLSDDVEARWRCTSLGLAVGQWSTDRTGRLLEQRRQAWDEFAPHVKEDIATYVARTDVSTFHALSK